VWGTEFVRIHFLPELAVRREAQRLFHEESFHTQLIRIGTRKQSLVNSRTEPVLLEQYSDCYPEKVGPLPAIYMESTGLLLYIKSAALMDATWNQPSWRELCGFSQADGNYIDLAELMATTRNNVDWEKLL
jgi:hypothetical protein